MQIRKRRLMGPGPSDVAPDTLAALAQPTVGHLDPQFVAMMDAIKALQRRALKTTSAHSYTLSAPGSAAMEAALGNVLEPGDRALICINGVFGGRLAEMARRLGAEVKTVEFPWGQPVDPETVRTALRREPAKLVGFVHAETSTGIRSDARALAAVASAAGALSLADCVTSLGGIEIDMDGWGLDLVYAGSQKCLSCVPGIAPLVLSDRAWEAVSARKTKPTSWFLDLSLLAGYWGGAGKRAYHHTAPVNAMYAWHHVLDRLEAEGPEHAWARHALHSRALALGLEGLGLSLPNPAEYALPQLTVVDIPEGIDDGAVRSTLLNDFDLEIGAGLGEFAGKVWRIGLMGHGARRDNVDALVDALGKALGREDAARSALADIDRFYVGEQAAA